MASVTAPLPPLLNTLLSEQLISERYIADFADANGDFG